MRDGFPLRLLIVNCVRCGQWMSSWDGLHIKRGCKIFGFVSPLVGGRTMVDICINSPDMTTVPIVLDPRYIVDCSDALQHIINQVLKHPVLEQERTLWRYYLKVWQTREDRATQYSAFDLCNSGCRNIWCLICHIFVKFSTGALQIKNNLTRRYQKPEIEFQLLMEAEEKVKSWETFGIKSNLRWNGICRLSKNSSTFE